MQQGMVFHPPPRPSVFLMSIRKNAPYQDSYGQNGSLIRYCGHDRHGCTSPRDEDQPLQTSTGNPTANGRFYMAAMCYQRGLANPLQIRVYQKLLPGIWSHNGMFNLTDAWRQIENGRFVFCFQLEDTQEKPNDAHSPDGRYIPTQVKTVVYKRDNGRCMICGSRKNLHFDHIIPYSKGGSSTTPKNIQLLCARHNLEKRDKLK